MVGVVGERNKHVTHVVHISIEGAIPAEGGRLHQVTQDVDARRLVQCHSAPVRL